MSKKLEYPLEMVAISGKISELMDRGLTPRAYGKLK